MSDAVHLPRASTTDHGWSLHVTPETAGWGYSGLRVLELGARETRAFDTGDCEHVLLPLRGSAEVHVDGERLELRGRRSVFSRVSDFAYLPRDASVTVTSAEGGRFALPFARCDRRLPVRHVPAEKVAVELRGAGSCSRQVNNFCSADAFEADRLMAVEVITPAGNTSSFPPHKHDEDRPGEESVLEEIYYFEVADGPESPGAAYQRVYGGGAEPVDLLAEVRDGDVVLIPRGWHGPSIALPGYDLYYLNVMAGPGERVWNICDDPDHAWVRSTWTDQEVDRRLPLTSAEEREGVR
ncbi:MAG: 5-deoxy-glucuronate isomerase [Kribbellaceae bacterium]